MSSHETNREKVFNCHFGFFSLSHTIFFGHFSLVEADIEIEHVNLADTHQSQWFKKNADTILGFLAYVRKSSMFKVRR